MLTRLNNSSSEFCSGVAVSRGLRSVANRLNDAVGHRLLCARIVPKPCARAMDVPQAVCFIDHKHVPWDLCDSTRLGGGEGCTSR
jgi:hypothetical protein